jgi:predicted amidohydrolase
MSQHQLIIGLYQGASVKGDIQGNIHIIGNVLKEQATNQNLIDLIIFPELFLTGYDLRIDEIQRLAISANDYSSSNPLLKISNLAYTFQVGIQIGYPERDNKNNTIYNSCLLVDAYGRRIINHRKIYLWDPSNNFESIVFTPGTCIPSLSTSDFTIRRSQIKVRIGSLICYDVHRSELAQRLVAEGGAQVILFSSAIACHETVMTEQIIATSYCSRAIENLIPVCFANMSGPCALDDYAYPFSGQSSVILKDGSIACSLGQETGFISYKLYI